MKAGVLNVRGEKYRATVLKVLEVDEFGRPRKFEALYDEESTNLQGGEHFWIIYAPAEMCRQKLKGNA